MKVVFILDESPYFICFNFSNRLMYESIKKNLQENKIIPDYNMPGSEKLLMIIYGNARGEKLSRIFCSDRLLYNSMCINNLRPDKCVGNLKLAVSKINYF